MTFNSHLFNVGLFNGNFNLGGELTSNDALSFGGYSLQNNNVITSDIDFEKIERDFQTSNVPNGNGMIINADFWRMKRIMIKGIITGSTRADLDDRINEFKKNLAKQNTNLDFILGNGTKRRFYCTATSIEVDRSRHYMITMADFMVSFDCLTPFGESIGYTSNSYSVSSLVYSEVLINEGTITSLPIFTLNVSAATAITDINITNNTTGEEIEITESITSGKLVIFDSENKSVTVDGVDVDFSGEFLSLNAGNNSYTITATGTSIAYALTAKTKAKFL